MCLSWPLAFTPWPAQDKLKCWEQSSGTVGDFLPEILSPDKLPTGMASGLLGVS
jgi:hypothetical protein